MPEIPAFEKGRFVWKQNAGATLGAQQQLVLLENKNTQGQRYGQSKSLFFRNNENTQGQR